MEKNPGTLYVRLEKGTKATGGFELEEEYDGIVAVPAPPVEVRIEGEGGVLALSGERKVSIVSRGVEQLEYTISRVPADEINHLVSQTEGEFQNPDFKHESFDENDIARIVREQRPIVAPDRFKANYSTFDFTNYLTPAADGGRQLQGLFFLHCQGGRPENEKVYPRSRGRTAVHPRHGHRHPGQAERG